MKLQKAMKYWLFTLSCVDRTTWNNIQGNYTHLENEGYLLSREDIQIGANQRSNAANSSSSNSTNSSSSSSSSSNTILKYFNVLSDSESGSGNEGKDDTSSDEEEGF